MIRVVADLGWQVEGDGQAGLALVQEIAEPFVGVGGTTVARILTHSPDPAPVGVGLDAAGVGVLPRIAKVGVVVQTLILQVLGAIERVNLQTAVSLKIFAPFRKSFDSGFQSFPFPLVFIAARHAKLQKSLSRRLKGSHVKTQSPGQPSPPIVPIYMGSLKVGWGLDADSIDFRLYRI